jgi:hypothetical protein
MTRSRLPSGGEPPRGLDRLVVNFLICQLLRAATCGLSGRAGRFAAGRRNRAEVSVKEKPQKNDDRNRDADHPKEQATAHDTILLLC